MVFGHVVAAVCRDAGPWGLSPQAIQARVNRAAENTHTHTHTICPAKQTPTGGGARGQAWSKVGVISTLLAGGRQDTT